MNQDKMKVLMFGWELPPNINGGLGVACAGLLSGLKNSGQVSVNFTMPQLLARSMSAAALATLAEPLADYFALHPAAGVPQEEAGARAPAGNYGAHLSEALSFALTVEDVLAQRGPFDVIHCHDWLTFFAGVVAKRRSGLPLVLHMHSIERDRGGDNPNPTIVAIERYALAQADAVIAVSNYARQCIIEEYGVPQARIVAIHNATRPLPAVPRRMAASSVPVVSFIGRVTAQKGPLQFVEAAHQILQRGVECRFVVAGTGDLLPTCRMLVDVHGMGERFEFPGFLDGAAVADLLARSAVFVMPSASEPFGIVALEAIHAGVPVVLSENSGVAEVIDSAIKVPGGDAGAIAAAVLTVLEDRALADELAARALREAQALSWDCAGSKTVALYRALLTAAGSLAPG